MCCKGKYSISKLSDFFNEVKAYSKGYYAVRKGYRWGLINTEGVLVLQCIYDWIWNIEDEIVSFRYKGRKSFVPLKLLPSKYEFIYGFHHGFSIVRLNDKSGVIAEDGEEVFPCIYDNLMYSEDRLFREYIDNNHIASEYYEGKWIVIDKWTLKVNLGRYNQIYIYDNGFKKVLSPDGKWGILDTYNREVIPCVYETIECILKNDVTPSNNNPFPNKIYFEAMSNGIFFIINTNNEILGSCREKPKKYFFERLIDMWYDTEYVRYSLEYYTDDNIPSVKNDDYKKITVDDSVIKDQSEQDSQDLDSITTQQEAKPEKYLFEDIDLGGEDYYKKWGFENSSGENIIPCKYEDAKDFVDGLAAVWLDGKWGFINTLGEVVIDLRYDDVYDFKNGISLVHISEWKGIISKDGVILAEKHDRHYSVAYNDSEDYYDNRPDWESDPLDAFEDEDLYNEWLLN